MATVDDILSGEKPKGVSVNSLTPQEKEDLKAAGYDIDGSEFVDLDLAPPQPEVDAKADERRKAVEELTSVAKPPPKEDPEPEKPSAAVDGLKGRVKELEELLGKVPQTCNRCGWPTGEKVSVEPTREDIKDFLRSIMAGEVFKKEYSLFGGELAVVFRTRTGEEESAIKMCLRRMIRDGDILQQHDLIGHSRRLNFICSLESYITKEAKLDFSDAVDTNGTNIVDQAERQVQRLPSQLLMMLMRQFDDFSELVDHLLAKVNDQGFWTGMSSTDS